jgi:histidinol dehydrogenase
MRRPAPAAAESEVARIIELVRRHGDDALRSLTARYDRVRVDSLSVPTEGVRVAPGLDRALRAMKRRIERFHAHTRMHPFRTTTAPGVQTGMRVLPYDPAGIYVPGGRAAYPSTVLMAAIPARLAGVREIVLCTPPQPDGGVPAPVLHAARLADIPRVFRVGGAQAIAAMAFGTASVPRCEIIVGPGNPFVAAAKRLLSNRVAVEFVAGPSEVLVLGDGSAPPAWIAAELVAQAEHGPDSVPMLVTTSRTEALAVVSEVARQAAGTARAPIIARALRNGAALVSRTLDDAVAFANEFAPEHLLIATRAPERVFARIRSCGAASLGARSSLAFADYGSGPNHILPTAGDARRVPPLTVRTFQRAIPYQIVSAAGARALRDAAAIARAEGLDAHAAAIEVRR